MSQQAETGLKILYTRTATTCACALLATCRSSATNVGSRANSVIRKELMYYKEIETSARAKAVHNDNQRKWAADRLKKLAAAKKARKAKA